MIIARPEGNNLPRYVLITFYTASAKTLVNTMKLKYIGCKIHKNPTSKLLIVK